MNAVQYTKRLRRVATVSWVASLAVFLGLVWIRAIPFNGVLPFAALLCGGVPIAVYALRNKPTCESCGGRMKISSGYPRIVYRCERCKSEVDTGIFSDY